jgi:hypothetical protein
MYVTDSDVYLAGLYPYIKWQLDEFPNSLHQYCGKGYGLWQYPVQFAPYLNLVLKYNIKNYLEIGVGAGGTFMFTADTLRKHGANRFYAVDIAPPGEVNYMNNEGSPFIGKLNQYLLDNTDCSFHQGDINDFLRSNPLKSIDLVLIDGNHSYVGCKTDYEAVKNIAKIMVFHDISNMKCPGVRSVWDEVKVNSEYTAFEFTDQYELNKSFLGIGVLIRSKLCQNVPL